jgi:ATP-binding cassette subfamily F protein uup
MSFKEKHALETLPRRISELTDKVAKLQKQLADPGLFGRDPKRFAEITDLLSDAELARHRAEEEWLELELLREEIGG